MQQDKFNEYYSIDFEQKINISHLKDFMKSKFQSCNISIIYNQENHEIINNKNDNKFKVWMSLIELKTDKIYDFSDIKIRSTMYISTDYKFSHNKIIKLLHEMSKVLQSKIYIAMDDVEQNLPSFSYYSAWCLDGDKMKIVFDAQEFCDNPKNHYSDYVPLL